LADYNAAIDDEAIKIRTRIVDSLTSGSALPRSVAMHHRERNATPSTTAGLWRTWRREGSDSAARTIP